MYTVGTSSADAQLSKLLQRDRGTLGCLLNEFRKLVSLPTDFEETLDGLLDSRNVLIHRLMTEDWVDLTTAKGRRTLRQFLRDLDDRCAAVGKILLGYLLVLSQKGHQVSQDAEAYLKKLSWGLARTSTVMFDDLPEDYFGRLFAEVRDEVAPRIGRRD
jgi:hypothetical protein